jgi:hypothetical protein
MVGVNLRYIVSTFVNVAMYPSYKNNIIIFKNAISNTCWVTLSKSLNFFVLPFHL